MDVPLIELFRMSAYVRRRGREGLHRRAAGEDPGFRGLCSVLRRRRHEQDLNRLKPVSIRFIFVQVRM